MDYAGQTARWLLGATDHPGGRALSAHLLDLLELPAGSLVADLACGGGATLDLLASRGHLAVGVDLDPRHPRAVVGDAQRLPLAGATFDAVLLECSLSTFGSPSDALAEVVRVLRPGGVLGLTDVLLDRSGAPAEVISTVDRLTGARGLDDYADEVRAAGLEVLYRQDRAVDALALLARLRQRLPLSTQVRRCQQAARDGWLSYGLVVARRPGQPRQG